MGSRTTARSTPLNSGKSRNAVVSRLEPKKPAAEAAEALSDSPLYGVAMLRMALELKRPDTGSFDEILARVVSRMGLEEAPLRRYLEVNGGLLLSLRRG